MEHAPGPGWSAPRASSSIKPAATSTNQNREVLQNFVLGDEASKGQKSSISVERPGKMQVRNNTHLPAPHRPKPGAFQMPMAKMKAEQPALHLHSIAARCKELLSGIGEVKAC